MVVISALSQANDDNFPKFETTSPRFGPISGGTTMTITGSNLGLYGSVLFVYMGEKIKLPVQDVNGYVNFL